VQDIDTPAEELAHGADVALGAVSVASIDAQVPAKRVERVGVKGERASGQDQRVEPVPDVERLRYAFEFGDEKANVPCGGVRHYDRCPEGGADFLGDRCERRGAFDLRRIDAMHVRCASDTFSRVDERTQKPHSLAADDAIDANFDDAVAHGVEAGHLEVHEGQRGFRDR
jgi:hypothetical protein